MSLAALNNAKRKNSVTRRSVNGSNRPRPIYLMPWVMPSPIRVFWVSSKTGWTWTLPLRFATHGSHGMKSSSHRDGWILHVAIGVRQTKQPHVNCSITNLRSTLINSSLHRSSIASKSPHERHQNHRRTKGVPRTIERRCNGLKTA